MPGGGPFNTARTIGRLGGQVAFLGRLSTDRFGGLLLEPTAINLLALKRVGRGERDSATDPRDRRIHRSMMEAPPC